MPVKFASLSRRLIVSIVAASSAITLIITAFQLYREYQLDVAGIEGELQQVERVHLAGVSETLWAADIGRLEVLLEGLSNFRDVIFVSVRDQEDTLVAVGDSTATNTVSRSYAITHEYRGDIIQIGTLRVDADLNAAYQRVLDRAVIIIFSNAVKTALVVLFMILILRHLITKRLSRITDYITSFSVEGPYVPLEVPHSRMSTGVNDDIDLVVASINKTSVQVIDSVSEIRKAEAGQRKSEQLLQVFIDRVPALVSIKNLEGQYLLINQQYIDEFGLDAGIDNETRLSNLFPPELAKLFKEQEQQVIDTNNEVTLEHTIPIGDGDHVHLCTKFPIAGPSGDIEAIGTISTDITERKNLEHQLRQAQRMEAVGQLTGGVAHDFNNLLAVMIGNSEMLEDNLGDDEQAHHQLDAIKRAVDRASSLTTRLMAFSRQQALAPVATNISNLIGDFAELLRRTLGETIDLRVEPSVDLWIAAIDPHQLENALVNLALNARDAMPNGGTLVIESANATLDDTYAKQYEDVTPGDYVAVAVSDTGIGMPPDVLERVFEPFFTTKEVGEGSGLGLSMVYGFTKQSDGHITVYSEEGEGTTVKLYMPRSVDATIQKVTKIDKQEVAGGSERILIVEDDPTVREVPVNILRNQGYEIFEAKDGKEAIKLLQDGPAFDLLFTDVVLPGGMNGVEIAEHAIQIQKNIKVLYTTGYTENSIIHHGKLIPGVTLVNKPYRRAELLEKIRAMLERKSVLIIEDNEDLRATLQMGLQRAGYQVSTATGGAEGQDLAKSNRFDVVVTDIVMDKGEGMETLKWINQHNPCTPVIAISGHPKYLNPIKKLGAAATLQKPFKVEKLIEIIKKVVPAKDGG